MKLKLIFPAVLVLLLATTGRGAETNWLARPLSLADALNTALTQNTSILKAKNDLEISHGLVIQTRAVALPHITASGQYKYTDPNAVEVPPFAGPGFVQPHQGWNAGIQIVQNIYDGGRNIAAIRSAGVTKKQAVAIYQTAVADALLAVRVAYYDVLLAAQQVVVREASVKLLEKELEDQKHRLDAGTVPRFNVLRAEVAAANERPALIQARNANRLAKNNLANLLGYNLPREIWEDIPLNLTDGFDLTSMEVNLPDAIQSALQKRTELEAARRTVDLQNLSVVDAKAGYQPTVSLFAGYNWFNSSFSTQLDEELNGWNAGAQLSWNIFDGAATYGKVKSAKAALEKSRTELVDQQRQIEIGVRTAYSDLLQARETLDSQAKVQESADEALREAKARAEAGTSTQLDVLNAETALTQSRTTQVQAQHDYATARARFERAVGNDLAPVK